VLQSRSPRTAGVGSDNGGENSTDECHDDTLSSLVCARAGAILQSWCFFPASPVLHGGCRLTSAVFTGPGVVPAIVMGHEASRRAGQQRGGAVAPCALTCEVGGGGEGI
jgi:hypothetical protein